MTDQSTTEANGRLPAWLRRVWSTASVPVAAVLLAALIGAIILAVSGANPIEAYAALIKGSFGDSAAFGRTLEKATPLVFSGLAVAFAFKAGLFNIGAQGQLLVGALVAAFIGFSIEGLPAIIHAPLGFVDRRVGRRVIWRDPRRFENLYRRARGHHHHHAQFRGH